MASVPNSVSSGCLLNRYLSLSIVLLLLLCVIQDTEGLPLRMLGNVFQEPSSSQLSSSSSSNLVLAKRTDSFGHVLLHKHLIEQGYFEDSSSDSYVHELHSLSTPDFWSTNESSLVPVVSNPCPYETPFERRILCSWLLRGNVN